MGWGLLKNNLGGFSNAYVVGAMGGLVGMLIAGMLGDWVIPFVYNVGLKGFRASVLGWIFLGGLVILVLGFLAFLEGFVNCFPFLLSYFGFLFSNISIGLLSKI